MKLRVPIRLRWSDIDAYAHVNNAAMLGLLEEVRIQAFWTVPTDSGATGDESGPAILDGTPGAETLSLIAHQEIEYLRPIPYGRQPLDCEVWIARLGGASLDVNYEVYTPEGVEPRELTTRAASTLVLVDTATQKPRRISTEERAAWSPYLEDPVVFTSRRRRSLHKSGDAGARRPHPRIYEGAPTRVMPSWATEATSRPSRV